jgi:hypothetical protein
MSKAPSVDLRIRVLSAVAGGLTHRQAGERFGVGGLRAPATGAASAAVMASVCFGTAASATCGQSIAAADILSTAAGVAEAGSRSC